MSTEMIKVPDLGGASDVEVIEICVAVGDSVEVEDSLVVLETDKASMEVPSPQAGKVVAILISEGDTINEGEIIVELETASAGAESQQEEPKSTDSDGGDQSEVQAETAETSSASESSSQAASAVVSVPVPDLGGATDVELIELCVAEGDKVEEGDSLIVLETDKASMEIPSPYSGTVASLAVKEGDTVNEGDVILELESTQVAGEKSPESRSENTQVANTQAANTQVTDTTSQEPAATQTELNSPAFVEERRRAQKVQHRISDARPSKNVYAGPSVRQLARELGVDLGDVSGSGPKGRIQKDDLHDYVKQIVKNKGKVGGGTVTSGTGIPPIPDVDFSKFGDVDIQPMTKIHKVTAANMQRSWLNVPHVTQFDDVDITDLEDFRKSLKAEAEKQGVKITPLPFLLKAAAVALKGNPKINASMTSDGESMVFKKYVHIGMAVDTPAGLVVPVIKDVDKKTIFELAAETAELAQKAKDRKLKPAEMQGACFTISSLGGIGGTGFTPIVNTPEVAILGVSKLDIKPKWNGSEFEPRKMLPVSMSYDHKAINGADAGRFLTQLGQLLGDIRRLAL